MERVPQGLGKQADIFDIRRSWVDHREAGRFDAVLVMHMLEAKQVEQGLRIALGPACQPRRLSQIVEQALCSQEPWPTPPDTKPRSGGRRRIAGRNDAGRRVGWECRT